jgi:two-component system, NarL family, invasion response regulator UvrY
MKSVLVVDGHPIVLQGCRCVLEGAGVGVFVASDVTSGFKLYRRHRPDVVIVDLIMPGNWLGGLPLIQRISSYDSKARILVFSMHNDPIIITRALEAGAVGYVLKDTASADLLTAFEAIRAGKNFLSPELAMKIALAHAPTKQQNPLAKLTRRELQTLSLLAEGRHHAYIAEELGVSYKTVVNLVYVLKNKLRARTLLEVVRIAVQLQFATSRPMPFATPADNAK